MDRFCLEVLIFKDSGVSRTAGGSIAVAVYSSILGNAQGKEAMRLVPAAVEAAGLDASAAPAVLAALPLGAKALSAVPGMTTDIAAAAGAAFQQSYVYGLK